MVMTNKIISRKPVEICKLNAADILLIHTKRSLWGYIIRFGTRCYWNHALIVCTVEQPEHNHSNTLIVDPKTDGRVEMDYISKYLGRLNKYNLAVKRLEAEWFQDDFQSGDVDFRSRICSVAANEAVSQISSKLVKFINRVIRQITVVYRFLRRKIKRSRALIYLPWNIKPIQMKSFTCSGFVQWCYYKGVSQVLEERGISKSRLQDVIFNPRVKKKVTPFELLTTTPADLANCAKLSWKYVIKDGVLREVSSEEEARLITVNGKRN